MDMFSRKSLEAHNNLRSAHNVPPLSWSNDLARGAQTWAKKLAKDGALKHDELKGIGENVFMASQGFDAAAEKATRAWYSEVNDSSLFFGSHQKDGEVVRLGIRKSFVVSVNCTCRSK